MRAKIADQTWPEGSVWRHAPDGRILVSVEGYNAWAETGAECARQARARSKSRLRSGAGAAASGSGSSPPPLT
ncbi:MAG: excisionase [Gammaproteobacteria bacterium]|nr:excisionase [Gammaproteobacteria bacterium]